MSMKTPGDLSIQSDFSTEHCRHRTSNPHSKNNSKSVILKLYSGSTLEIKSCVWTFKNNFML